MELCFECPDTGVRHTTEVPCEDATVADLKHAAAVCFAHPEPCTVTLTLQDTASLLTPDTLLLADSPLCMGSRIQVRFSDAVVWAHAVHAAGEVVSNVFGVSIAYAQHDVVLLNLASGEATIVYTGDAEHLALTATHVVVCTSSDLLFVSRTSDGPSPVRLRHHGSIRMLAVSSEAACVVVGETSGISFFSYSGDLLNRLDGFGHSFAVSPCGSRILRNVYPEMVISNFTGETLLTVQLPHLRSFAIPPQISSDGALLLCCVSVEENTRRLWVGCAVTGEAVCLFPSYLRPASACFSACGKHIFTSSDDGTIHQWDARSGDCLGSFPYSSPHIVAASTDGVTLLLLDSMRLKAVPIPDDPAPMIPRRHDSELRRGRKVKSSNAECECTVS